MRYSDNVFASLTTRAEGGESSAQRELQQELEPAVVHMVRRVVRKGAGNSTIDQRILAEARRIGLDADIFPTEEGERMIRTLARKISCLFVDRLGARRLESCTGKETVGHSHR